MPKAKAMKSRILAHRGAQPNGLGGCSASPWIYLRHLETAACMDTIVTHICARGVIPIVPVGRVLEQQAVPIKGGQIAATAPTEELALTVRATTVIERPKHVLLPGFVNAH